MRLVRGVMILIGFQMLLIGSIASAETVAWSNDAGGLWETAANWSTGTVPGPGDDVIIDSTGAGSISLNSGTTINTLVLGGTAMLELAAIPSTLSLTPVPPRITTHPENQTVAASQGGAFSVVATGSAPLSYLWRKNGVPIIAANSPTYTFTDATSADAGSYDVIVSNSVDSLASNPATLTVLAAGMLNTHSGLIQGTTFSGGFEFLGIPYAMPPVGSLRWAPSREPLSWDSVLDTRTYRSACPQKRFEQGQDTYQIFGDEDCLYLNVWTPRVATPTLPVLVFIHGGGNQQGSASEVKAGTRLYDGRNLSTRGDAVVVTLQYRLGPLGFLVHPGLETESPDRTSGNYAVLDQIMALQWIKRNIGRFGGDPERVLIFGESAGGLDVGNLLVSPLASGLFQRACIQSAVPVIDSYEDGKAKGIAWVNAFSSAATDSGKIADLRALDWETLVATNDNPLDGGLVQLNWQPVRDDRIFPLMPLAAFSSGTFNQVPLMIGSNADELSLSAPATVSPAMVTSFIALTVPPALQDQAHLLYPSGNTAEEARKSYVQILTDSQFTAPVRRVARAVAPRSSSPVWRYFFTHHQAGGMAAYGSYHGIELFYVFNTWENSPFAAGPLFTAGDQTVEDITLKYWVNFARTGDPNGAGLALWPHYQVSGDCYLEINPQPDGSQCGVRTDKSDFWDAVAVYH
ncbi:MAG: carboxylesterase family protein [Desulfuromonadales bacterium]|nr:carboxylesterase family protein [Desulfuromonadales bacterium]